MRAKNILITGPPGSGKSTLIERVVGEIRSPLRGFLTREIRKGERRTGFFIITLDGREGVLADEKSRSGLRVGRYGVNIEQLEGIAVPAIIPANPGEIVIIDEIGKMECLSPLFRRTLIETLDSPYLVVGSIVLKGDAFIEEIKRRKDVQLISLSTENRDGLAAQLLAHIRNNR
jgi:nucleoside-triphosphatase THEP1